MLILEEYKMKKKETKKLKKSSHKLSISNSTTGDLNLFLLVSSRGFLENLMKILSPTNFMIIDVHLTLQGQLKNLISKMKSRPDQNKLKQLTQLLNLKEASLLAPQM